MRTRLALALAATVLTLTAPADAGPPNDSTYHGGCFLVAYNETTQLVNPATDQWDGVLGALVVSSAASLGHNVVAADVRCTIYVTNVLAGNNPPTFTGTGVTAGFEAVSFTAPRYATIDLCTDVTTTDAHLQVTVFPTSCRMATIAALPTQEAYDELLPVCVALNEYTLCNLLKANRGSVLFAI